jgi:hypothetical protein
MMIRHEYWVQGWMEAHEDDDPPPTWEDAEEAYHLAKEAYDDMRAEDYWENRNSEYRR